MEGEAEVAGDAAGKVVAEGRVVEQAVAEVAEALPLQPPDPGLVFSTVIPSQMAPCD